MNINPAIVRISTTSILLALILNTAYPAFAIDATRAATQRKELTQERIETRKENIRTRIDDIKEKMASREAELKTKLSKFKDQQKAQIAERVNTNLNMINKNQTTEMQKNLAKMTTILDKLQARVPEITPEITNARSSIATASSAVTAQAAKDYTITVTTESKIRADAMKTRDQLQKDLKATRALVVTAKQSVAKAISINMSAKEGTPSGQR